MHRKLSLLFTLFCLLAAPLTSNAFWWWFSNDDEWKEMDPIEQDAKARPYFQRATQEEKEKYISSAISCYQDVWEKFPGSKYSSDALYRYSELLFQRHKWKKAYTGYYRLIRSYPDNPYYNQVIERLFDIASAYEEGKNVYYMWFFESPSYEKALSSYENLLTLAPYSDYAPLALMRIALIHNKEGDEIDAIDALDRLINRYPNDLLTPDAYLNLADTFGLLVDGADYDQGATREAISYYRDFLILYKENPSIIEGEKGLAKMQDILARSKLILGKFYYQKRDNFEAAKIFLNETIDSAPKSPSADEARIYLKKIEKIEKHYPNGDWPRRTDLQHIFNPSFDLADELPEE